MKSKFSVLLGATGGPSLKTRTLETIAQLSMGPSGSYLTRPVGMQDRNRKTFFFEVLCENHPLPAFKAGQSLPVSFPGEGILSRPRLLAPVSSPATKDRLVFCLNDRDDWALALRTRLEGIAFEGMKALRTRLGRATGSFCLKKGSGPLRHVFLAEGMGAAPVLSMIESIRDSDRRDGRLLFVWGAEIRDEFFDLETIESIFRLIAGSRFVPVLSHDPLWRGERGELDAALLDRVVAESFGMESGSFEWALPSWYISAPPERVRKLRRALLERGALPQAIHTSSGRS